MHRNITLRRLALDWVQYLGTQKAAVRVLGRPFSRSHRYVEIDITYRCNLRCRNCNRSCTQAPSPTDISVETIDSFVAESIARGIRWERIRLLGGEPTLHPALPVILDRLLGYRAAQNPALRIVLCTNGSGRRVNRVLAALPKSIAVKSTAKSERQRLFRPFNRAPVDSRWYRFADYSAGCRILSDCGLGLTPLGYYPCAVAGGIDRVFGFGRGRQHLPEEDDDMRDLTALLCRYCGHFGFLWPTKRQKTSPAWQAAYSRYRKGLRASASAGAGLTGAQDATAKGKMEERQRSGVERRRRAMRC